MPRVQWILGVHYFSAKKIRLVGYYDSDDGNSISDQKSTPMHYFPFGSEFINWSSKKESIVALSITQVKYMAAAVASTQVCS